jgi:hypothetical protein
MSAALRAQLPLIGFHASRNAIDIRNKAATYKSGVVGAIHALLARPVSRLLSPRRAGGRSRDRSKQDKAGVQTNLPCFVDLHLNPGSCKL